MFKNSLIRKLEHFLEGDKLFPKREELGLKKWWLCDWRNVKENITGKKSEWKIKLTFDFVALLALGRVG